MSREGLGFIGRILGEQLSSVEFVQDYLQLHFDGPTLTLFVWPVVFATGQMYQLGKSGCFRDELCGRIAHKVVEVVTDDSDALTIRFDDSSSVVVSLRPEDRTGPETGYFRDDRDPRGTLRDF